MEDRHEGEGAKEGTLAAPAQTQVTINAGGREGQGEQAGKGQMS